LPSEEVLDHEMFGLKYMCEVFMRGNRRFGTNELWTCLYKRPEHHFQSKT